MKVFQKYKKYLVIFAIFIMIMLIISMGANTYSKYIIENSTGEQIATVTKWGFVINVNTENLLGENYNLEEGNKLATTVINNGISVNASANNKIVAPGTTGKMIISIKGNSEVASKISIKNIEHSSINLGEYLPVKWTLKEENTILIEGSIDTILTKLKDSISKNIDANENVDKNYTLIWEWMFDNNEETNIKDTIIGYKLNGKTYSEVQEIYNSKYNKDINSLGVSEEIYNNSKTNMSMNFEIVIEQRIS